MDFERFEDYVAIGYAQAQVESAARASQFDKQLAKSSAEFDRRTAGHGADMEELQREIRVVVTAIHGQTITLNRLMCPQTKHEQAPDTYRKLPRPA